MKIGIIGCGLIGQKRAAHLGGHELAVVCDVQPARAQALAAKHPGARVAAGWSEVVADPALDAVFIAVTHDQLAPIARAALEAGRHVLVEKPGARCAEELRPVAEAARRHGRTVRVGFNHRFHPALLKAHEIFRSGALGPMMFVRGRYGHGGRLGYDREWRADPAISGGGEAVDQGVHLVDLARWFLGELRHEASYAPTYFWDMPVEDNAFMLLKGERGEAAWLHATWTEWKNLFSLEIYGRIGKLHIEGLGGSYGPERLTYYRMLPQLGPPEVESWDFTGPDTSWAAEFEHFQAAIAGRPSLGATVEDAVAALAIVDQVKRRPEKETRRP